MITKNVNPRRRGRPPGPTARGQASREHLYAVALALMAERGYAGTTLRDIAAQAEVSPGLLYRYFPSKQAIVMALYDALSSQLALQAALPEGPFLLRARAALDQSLAVLAPHRALLGALLPALLGAGEDGLFSAENVLSRQRVRGLFERAAQEATDAPDPETAGALGRLSYLAHLGVILFWLLDRSDAQRATQRLIALLPEPGVAATLALRLGWVQRLVRTADGICGEGLWPRDEGEG